MQCRQGFGDCGFSRRSTGFEGDDNGVNIVTGLGPRLADKVALIRAELASREIPLLREFEISVFVADRSPEAAREAEIPDGVDRLTVLVRP